MNIDLSFSFVFSSPTDKAVKYLLAEGETRGTEMCHHFPRQDCRGYLIYFLLSLLTPVTYHQGLLW